MSDNVTRFFSAIEIKSNLMANNINPDVRTPEENNSQSPSYEMMRRSGSTQNSLVDVSVNSLNSTMNSLVDLPPFPRRQVENSNTNYQQDCLSLNLEYWSLNSNLRLEQSQSLFSDLSSPRKVYMKSEQAAFKKYELFPTNTSSPIANVTGVQSEYRTPYELFAINKSSSKANSTSYQSRYGTHELFSTNTSSLRYDQSGYGTRSTNTSSPGTNSAGDQSRYGRHELFSTNTSSPRTNSAGDQSQYGRHELISTNTSSPRTNSAGDQLRYGQHELFSTNTSTPRANSVGDQSRYGTPYELFSTNTSSPRANSAGDQLEYGTHELFPINTSSPISSSAGDQSGFRSYELFPIDTSSQRANATDDGFMAYELVNTSALRANSTGDKLRYRINESVPINTSAVSNDQLEYEAKELVHIDASSPIANSFINNLFSTHSFPNANQFQNSLNRCFSTSSATSSDTVTSKPSIFSTPTRRKYSEKGYDSEIPKSKMCSFCRKNGEISSVYLSHAVRERIGNKKVVTCPILRAYVCPSCGESGDRAHTIAYCPKLKDEGNRVTSVTVALKNTKVQSKGTRRH